MLILIVYRSATYATDVVIERMQFTFEKKAAKLIATLCYKEKIYSQINKKLKQSKQKNYKKIRVKLEHASSIETVELRTKPSQKEKSWTVVT